MGKGIVTFCLHNKGALGWWHMGVKESSRAQGWLVNVSYGHSHLRTVCRGATRKWRDGKGLPVWLSSVIKAATGSQSPEPHERVHATEAKAEAGTPAKGSGGVLQTAPLPLLSDPGASAQRLSSEGR